MSAADTDPLTAFAPEVDAATLAPVLDGLAAEGFASLEIHFASLPRRVGRDLAGSVPATRFGAGQVLPGAYRRCDLAAARVLREAMQRGMGAAEVERLYFQGDAEERRMILRSLALLDGAPAAERLLVEAHRTNDQVLFEAGVLDSDLAARVLSEDDFNNAVLKVAFLGLPLERLLGASGRANAALSGMLLDFMSEREAAGRPVWDASLELAARAPCPGVRARILGHLWHGRDQLRLAAARGAAALANDEVVASELRAREAVERNPAVREALRAARGGAS